MVASLVSAYQIYSLATTGAMVPGYFVYLGYLTYAMPILALIAYAVKYRWLAAVFASVAVALSNSVAMAAFLLVLVYGEVSGKY